MPCTHQNYYSVFGCLFEKPNTEHTYITCNKYLGHKIEYHEKRCSTFCTKTSNPADAAHWKRQSEKNQAAESRLVAAREKPSENQEYTRERREEGIEIQKDIDGDIHYRYGGREITPKSNRPNYDNGMRTLSAKEKYF